MAVIRTGRTCKTTQGWTQISGPDSYPVTDYQNDLAAIEFKTPFTFTGTFMPVLYSAAPPTSVTNGGYPARGQRHTPTGTARSPDPPAPRIDTYLRASHVREFAIDASGGDSGSPFFYVDRHQPERPWLGSLSYGDDLNDVAGGPWYDSWNQALLSAWVSWTPQRRRDRPDRQHRPAHRRPCSPPLQIGSQSYLRFYNSDRQRRHGRT